MYSLNAQGILKFGFGRDVLLRNLKVHHTIFQEKSDPFIYIPISPILGPILSKITQFFQNFLTFEPILAQNWANFEKSTIAVEKKIAKLNLVL